MQPSTYNNWKWRKNLYYIGFMIALDSIAPHYGGRTNDGSLLAEIRTVQEHVKK
jgi:hypothetical protein